MKNAMRRGAAIVFYAALAVLICLGFLFLPRFQRTGNTDADTAAQPYKALPGTEWRGVKIISRDHGKAVWELQARQVIEAIGGLVIEAYGIHDGAIYEKDKQGVSCTFQAGSAHYDTIFKQLQIKGNILVKLSDDTTITAAEASADLRLQTVAVPVPVRMEGREISFTADGLTADLAEKMVTLTGNVLVTWDGGTIKAAQVVYSVDDGLFTITGQNEGEGIDLTL